MRVMNDGNYTYLNLKDEFGKVDNEAVLIIGSSGFGKGLASAGLAQTFYNEGYTVISITDPKDEAEMAYAMFEPKEDYHVAELKRFKIKPEAVPVKLYHPVTSRLPRNKGLPDMNYYTIPIKDLTEDEFSLLVETDYQSEAIRLMMAGAESISNEAGLYTFLHTVQDFIRGQKKGKIVKPSPRNFYLESGSGGAKSMTEISSLMQVFKTDCFLSSKNNPLALDIKSIMNDNTHYHVFLGYYMPYKQNGKIRDFLVLSVVSQLVKNIRSAKHPIVLIIPEVSKQMPSRSDGYKRILGEKMRSLIISCRSQGRGVSTISDNQTLTDVDEGYSKSAKSIFLGALGQDVERVVKIFGYNQERRKRLLHPTYRNSFTYVGEEDEEIYIRFPSHMWAESHYNFEEMYRKEFAAKLKTANPALAIMEAELGREEEKIKEKVKLMEDELERVEEEKKARKSKASEAEDKKQEKKKVNSIQAQQKYKGEIIRLLYEEKINNPELSFNKLAKKFKIGPHTAKRYYDEYAKTVSQPIISASDEESIKDQVTEEKIDAEQAEKPEET